MNSLTRRDQLWHLSQKSKVSVLIIGAGINGIATFRDLALQHVDVLLVDKGDFCSGTSSSSSHMIHGGLRYLENGEFRLVREAVQERNRLLQLAPHYVKPLPTMIPIFNWCSGIWETAAKFLGRSAPFSSSTVPQLVQSGVKGHQRGGAIVKLGLMLYELWNLPPIMTKIRMPNHRFQLRTSSLKQFPELSPDIVATAIYYDAVVLFPERLAIELVVETERMSQSANAINYLSVVGMSDSSRTVLLQDEVSGKQFQIQPELVINATGPWIDLTNKKLNQPTDFIGGTKGSHLVLDHPQLRESIGEHMVFFENDDGRIVLLLPYFDNVIVGTTDIRVDQPEVCCTQEEITYLLEMIGRVFPHIKVEHSQIVYTFSGVRPLPNDRGMESTGQISRDHQNKIVKQPGCSFPVFNLVGGKWTTFRTLAEQVTDQSLEFLGRRRCIDTRNLMIGGGKDYPFKDWKRWVDTVAGKYQVDPEIVRKLFNRYGTGAKTIIKHIWEPLLSKPSPHDKGKLNDFDFVDQTKSLSNASSYYVGEVRFIAEQEKVVFVEDFIRRRSNLALLGQDTPQLKAELTEIMADLLPC
ncbi:FAD-dependent oxidoreductase [Candidatus Poribacteria bacterium]|nr:FAD-dependent oxidoreductase [Candidatus Poribacteria bacterium]